MEAQKAKYRRRGGLGRILCRSDQRAGRAHVRPAAVVETYKRLGRVERAFRTMKASDLQVQPIRHRLEPRVRAHLLICMLAYYVEKHMREALAPMLFDDERGPVRDSPVAKAERSPQAKRKATSKRTSSRHDVHDFRGLLEQLGTLTMNRIEPSEPGKPGFDVPASPTPIQDQALRLLNAKQPYRRGGHNSDGIAAGAGRRGVVRVLHSSRLRRVRFVRFR